MRAIIFIVIALIMLIGLVIFMAAVLGKGKKKPPPPVLPKQYHDRYPKRSEFLKKGAPVDEEMPKIPLDMQNSTSTEDENDPTKNDG